MIVMSDKHLARAVLGKLPAGHMYPRPSDRKPVFMFGTFDLDGVGATSVHTRYRSSFGTKAGGGARASARRMGSRGHAEATTDESSAFMFGVHPE
jgi:hypothetical protein